MRNQALETRGNQLKYFQSSQILCFKSFSLDTWLVFESSSLCLSRLLRCRGSMHTAERCALGTVDNWSCVSGGLVVLPRFPPAIFLTLANHITSLCLRFSSHIKQEPSPPSEELGELIKAYSGMRLMPIVQGIVKTLSGVQFSYPFRRWMTANQNRCREELLGEVTEKITGGWSSLGEERQKAILIWLSRKRRLRWIDYSQ